MTNPTFPLPRVLDRAGWYLLSIIALFGLATSSVYQPGEILLVVLSAIALCYWWPFLKNSPLFWIMALWIVYVAARSAVAVYIHGYDNINPQLPPWEYVLGSAVAGLMSGLWLHSDPARLKWLVGFAIVGMLLYLLRDTDWGMVASALSGDGELTSRAFSTNYNRYATVVVLLLVAVLTLGTYFCATLRKRYAQWLFCALMISAIIFLWYVLILTGSRQAIVGATVATAFSLALVPYLLGYAQWWKYALVSGLVGGGVAVVALGSGYLLSDALAERIDQVFQSVAQLASNPDVATMDLSGSANKRVYILLSGLELVGSYWVLGVGPVDPSLFLDRYNAAHYHNIYLEVLVGFGVLGFLLFLGGLVGVVRFFGLGALDDDGNKPYWVFVIVSLLALLTMQLFSSRIASEMGRYIMLISLAGAGARYFVSLGGGASFKAKSKT